MRKIRLCIGVALGIALDVAFFPVFAMVRGTAAAEDEAPGDDKRP